MHSVDASSLTRKSFRVGPSLLGTFLTFAFLLAVGYPSSAAPLSAIKVHALAGLRAEIWHALLSVPSRMADAQSVRTGLQR